MAVIQIVLRSREVTDLGMPRRLGVYEIGTPREIGRYYNVPVTVLRENELHVPRPPVQLAAASAHEARELAISHYQDQAAQLKLEIKVFGQRRLARSRSVVS